MKVFDQIMQEIFHSTRINVSEKDFKPILSLSKLKQANPLDFLYVKLTF